MTASRQISLRILPFLLAGATCLGAGTAPVAAPVSPESGDARRADQSALTLEEVLASVTRQYPPYLAALIERDIMEGRVRQASGAFDLALVGSVNLQPDGYYDGEYGKAVLDQPLPFWGGNAYVGYRLSGGFLPNYNKERTADDGAFIAGFKLPLLKDGSIDRRRVALKQAKLDEELADPFILRQHIDFLRAATNAYFNWLASGRRLILAEQLLDIARRRNAGIGEKVDSGALAPIVKVDNERLVVAREIALVQSLRRFEAASLELSLFIRDKDDLSPRLCGRDRLPDSFPATVSPDSLDVEADIARAVATRPEMRRYELSLEKIRLDRELADNHLLPDLQVGAMVAQSVDGRRLKDVEQTEVSVGVELRVPLERNEAKGRLAVAKAQLARLENERNFAKDKIANEVRDSVSALRAAELQLRRTGLNVELAQKLFDAEDARFKLGASDLLAFQIREQAVFDARVTELGARADYFRAMANYRAAVAADAPSAPVKKSDSDFHPAEHRNR